MNFTGERYIPTEQGRIRLEHFHRYLTVLDIVKGKTVLDLACGEGYGSSLMAEVAQSVVGIDVADDAVLYASSTYARPNLEFLQGSAASLNLPDDSFDVVVSFETIEHLSEQEEMLAEIRRVLRSNGVLIISSPNRPVYSEESEEVNEFHVKELDFQEFDAVIRTQFSMVEYYGQRLEMLSVIQSLTATPSVSSVWSDDGVNYSLNAGTLKDPIYFLALCGSANSIFPDLGMSFLSPKSLDLVKHYVGFAKWAKSLEVVVAEREERIVRLTAMAAQLADTTQLNTQITSLSEAIAQRDTQINSLSQAAVEYDRQIATLTDEAVRRGEWASRLDAELIDARAQLANATQLNTQINSLSEAIAQRDTQINSLSEAIAQRDTQINSLSEAIAQRDTQINSLSHTATKLNTQITSLSDAVAQRDNQINSLSHAALEYDRQIANLTDETVRRGEWALRLDAELNDTQAQLIALIGSNSWRLMLPLREARRWVSSPIEQAKRYAKVALRLAKYLYQSLPLNAQTKARHRQLIAKTLPRLLFISGSPPATISSFSIPSRVAVQTTVPQAASLLIQSCESPIVSIIIPVYGKIDYTLRCIASIANNLPDAAFEVIVVDDCSTDDSFDILSKNQGIRLLRNQQNEGFIRSCNHAAKFARGVYLHFLNNDTVVTSGFMDELLRTFREFPGAGMAGSKLVYQDGRLQEAGGIIWQDGSAWNFGRFQDPLLPVYNYAREVDYCSGASIMVPKILFDELGGFDEHYLPAYCEDSDLALKIREKGYRVIYQPMSTVIHFEGITSGTDTSHGAKSYQVENSKKLFTRWQNRLAKHEAPGTHVDRAKDRKAARRVLVIDHCTPTPNQDAGSVTVFNMLLLLREMGFQVTFIPEDNFLFMPEYSTALQRAGVEVLYAPYVTSVTQHLKEYGNRYDLALLFRPGVVTRHLKEIRKHCPSAKVLYHTVDLHYLRLLREAELESDKTKKKAAEEMKKCELDAIGSVDACIVHSTTELELLRPLLPKAKVYVFPLILDIQGTSKSYQERSDIVFVGGYNHAPNVDAVKFFVEEVMPLVRKKLANVRFFVVGSNPPAEIKALACEDIVIAGFVEDLTSLLDKMRVSVAPLRYGAGIKGKIGSAMAVGLPVVASTLAAEGMSLTHGENILIADGAEALADALVEIYQNELQWNRISLNSLAFTEKAWGAEAAWGILAAILADMGMRVERSSSPLSLYSKYLPTHTGETKLLQAIGIARNRIDFKQILVSNALKQTDQITQLLLTQADSETFTVDGFCAPCNKNVSFLVDMQSGGVRHAHGFTPNWRERLECPLCRMNNRQRLISTLMKQVLSNKQGKQVYLMEQVTPIFNWAMTTFKHHKIVGSEYIGHEYPSGAIVKGLRHEDIENMSFADGQLDLIISNDVFEHVPNPDKAFAECARVLKVGGIMLATIPFHSNNDASVIRARLHNGQVENILPPAFHGNPISSDGSLVFTDFGWDLISTAKEAGFADMVVDVYADEKFGHLGSGQLVFRFSK